MKETFKHIGDSACFQRQKLYWNIIPLNQEIGIEIINFWKSRVVTPTGGGVYMEFAASFINNLPEPKVESGDILIIHISYRCMVRAVEQLPLYKKKFINRDMGNDNVYIKFIKKNDQAMDILDIEQRKEDQGMTQAASNIFDNKRDYLTDAEVKENETNTQ